MSRSVLIAENDKSVSSHLKQRFEDELGYSVSVVPDKISLEGILAHKPAGFFCALVSLGLADSYGEESVIYLREKGIPVIAYSEKLDKALREKVLRRDVVDYLVVGDNPAGFDYAMRLVRRLDKNREVGALVVDDSRTTRTLVAHLLELLCFQVHTAEDGFAALESLEKHPEIRLAVIDQNMPGMTGAELMEKIRKEKSMDDFCIIGISAYGKTDTVLEYLKRGANDFLLKPFVEEEFVSRTVQNVEMVENIRAAKEAAIKDPLTKLYNRRYLFDAGKKMFANAKRGNVTLSVGMVDIDHFKRINDKYGHGVGDAVIRYVSGMLGSSFRQGDIVARTGGEEFCILAVNTEGEKARGKFDKVREEIATRPCRYGDLTIPVSVSIGVTDALQETLDKTITLADDKLYEAKKNGRNQTVFHLEREEA